MLTLLLVLPALAEAPSYPEGEVRSIRVEGTRFTEREVVLGALPFGRGDPVHESLARTAVSDVFSTGLYEDVRLDWEPAGSKVDLVVTVSERPTVRSVLFEGVSKVDEEELHELVQIPGWSVLAAGAVAAAEERVRDHYVAEGYWLASVDGVVLPIDEGQVDIRFVVDERRKVRVERVDFEGNEALGDGALRRSMATREGGLLPWLTRRGTYQPRELELDRQRILARYWEEGHLDAVVDSPVAHLSVDERSIFVRVPIDEGRPYVVGALAIEGDLAPELGLSSEVLLEVAHGARVLDIEEAQWREATGRRVPTALTSRDAPALRAGERFRLGAAQHTAERLRVLVGDRGHAFAAVTPLPYPDAQTGIVDVHFAIELGERQHVRSVHFHGNDPTFDHVLRREFSVYEGEPWHSSRIEAARRALLRVDWFDRVEVDPRPTGIPGQVDVHVTVVEKPVQNATAGLSSDSLGGLGATGTYQSRNMFGTGLSGGANINWAKRNKALSLSLFEPAILDSPWSAGVSVSATNQQAGLAERRKGASLSIGRALDPKRHVRLTARLSTEHREVLNLDPFRERLFGGELFRTGWTNQAGLALSIDKRNGQLHATRGWYASVGAGLAGGMRIDDQRRLDLLGGDFQFAEVTANLRLYQPVLKHEGHDALVLRFNSEVGVRQSTDGRMLPWVQRYRLGGPDSVRGYRPWSIGPRVRTLDSEDPVHADQAMTVGGTAQWVNNLELEANILPRAGISVVGFIDAGQATGDPWGKGAFDPAQMKVSAGVGVRWLNSPLGPIRVEVGVPLNPDDGRLKPAVQLGFGVNF